MSLRWFLPLALLLLLCTRGAVAQPNGPAQLITIEHADSLLGTVVDGEEIITLQGHVVLTQGVTRIVADRTRLNKTRNAATLTGNVRITQPGSEVAGPRIEYDGSSRLATAPEGFMIADKGVTMRGNSGTYNINGRHATFRGNVSMQNGGTTLRAGSGEYDENDQKAWFRDGVKVETDSGTITSSYLVHSRATGESFATGNVVVSSRGDTAQLRGDTVLHRPQDGYTFATGHASVFARTRNARLTADTILHRSGEKYSLAIGRPKLVQVDTSRDSSGKLRFDTTTITSLRMESFRGTVEEYIATDSVRLVRDSLQAVGALARYRPGDSLIALGPGSRAGDSTVRRDTLARLDTTVKDNGVTGNRPPILPLARGPYPVVWYTHSQLTGDSITLHLAGRSVRTVDVLGNAFSLSEGKVSNRYDQLAGSRLIFDVAQDTIRRVHAEGYAASIYWVYDKGEPDGVNRTAGDTITVWFDSGEASEVRVIGGRLMADGEYVPEQMAYGQEGTFRLDGFRLYDRDGSIRGRADDERSSSAEEGK